jgi:hypothetical protein
MKLSVKLKDVFMATFSPILDNTRGAQVIDNRTGKIIYQDGIKAKITSGYNFPIGRVAKIITESIIDPKYKVLDIGFDGSEILGTIVLELPRTEMFWEARNSFTQDFNLYSHQIKVS